MARLRRTDSSDKLSQHTPVNADQAHCFLLASSHHACGIFNQHAWTGVKISVKTRYPYRCRLPTLASSRPRSCWVTLSMAARTCRVSIQL